MARVEGVEPTESTDLKGSKAAQTFKKQSPCCNDLVFAVLFLANLFCLACLGLYTYSEGGGIEGHLNRTEDFVATFGNGTSPELTPFGLRIDDTALWQKFTSWLVEESINVQRDVKANYDLMAMAGVVGICIGITWLQLLKRLTSFVVHLTMVLVVLAVTAVGFLFHRYSEGCLVDLGELTQTLGGQDVACVDLAELTQTESDVLKYLAFAVWLVAAVIFLAIFLLRSKVSLTVTIFEEACSSCLTNMGIYPVTIFVIFLVLAFHVFWGSTAIYLFSVETDVGVPFLVDTAVPVRLVLLYFAFSYFWVCAFLRALFHSSVAGIVGNWYFNRHHASVGSPLLSWWRPLWSNITVSCGSLAMGAFSVAVCSFIRYILKKFERWSKRQPALATAFKCCKCCMCFVEKAVTVVNEYAYVYIAMERVSFCSGAKKAFKLISQYPVQLVVMKSINSFVLMCGKLFLTSGMVLLFVLSMENFEREFCGLFVFLVGLALYQVFKIQADVIQAAVDTVFVCYVMDLSLNDGEAVHLKQSASNLHQKVQAAVAQYEADYPQEVQLQKGSSGGLPRSESGSESEAFPVATTTGSARP
jgi:hypothetical protein